MSYTRPRVERPNLVLVHLGQLWPAYIQDCVQQLLLFNPDVNVWVAARSMHRSRVGEALGSIVHFVSVEELPISDAHSRFKRSSRLDSRFRGGFWRYATERFFILDEFIREAKLPSCFHIENDVLIYCSLSRLLPVFVDLYPGIAATFDNDSRCVPGFMYFGSSESASNLVDFLARRENGTLNDMDAIGRYRQLFGTRAIESLPIVPEGYDCAWTTSSGSAAKNPSLFLRNADRFKSVFDAAAIGQFLGGPDPRNEAARASGAFINESCVFSPNDFGYHWQQEEEGLVPYLMFQESAFRINNLHIHSKNLAAFRSDRNQVGQS